MGILTKGAWQSSDAGFQATGSLARYILNYYTMQNPHITIFNDSR